MNYNCWPLRLSIVCMSTSVSQELSTHIVIVVMAEEVDDVMEVRLQDA